MSPQERAFPPGAKPDLRRYLEERKRHIENAVERFAKHAEEDGYPQTAREVREMYGIPNRDNNTTEE